MNTPSGDHSPSVDSLLNADVLNSEETHPADSMAAYERFVSRYGSPKNRAPIRRPVWMGAAAACALIALLSFAPARSWGQRILSMLRVQKVAVVPVDMEAISSATNGHEKLLAQMISDRVVVTMKPGEPTPVSGAAAASSAAGFEVKTLDGLGTPSRILVRDEAAFHVQLDRDRMLALLEAAGRSDISLPNSVDGSEIAVHIPRVVDIAYGECTAPRSQTCVHFTQVPSPTISLPPSLDIASLAEAALQVTGMTPAEAKSFCQTVDWSSTLVIPIPRNGSTSRTVPVNGVNGTLVETAASNRHGAEYILVWVQGHRIFSLSGSGDSGQALAVAESLN